MISNAIFVTFYSIDVGEWDDDCMFPYWFDYLDDGIIVLALFDHSS